MLKINLLPAYIYEKRKVRKMIALFVVLFFVTVAGVTGYTMKLIKQENELTANVTAMEARANQVKAIEAQIAAEKTAIAGTKAKTDYIEAVMKYNVESVNLYENLAKYTYSRILYTSITPSGGTSLAINAHARTLGDCGRYLLNMYRATSLFSSVTINGVPGWQPGSESGNGFDFTVNCTLVKPIVPPVYAPGGGGGSAPAAGGAGTGMPGATAPGAAPPPGGGGSPMSPAPINP